MASRWILSCILISCIGIDLSTFGREHDPIRNRLLEEQNLTEEHAGGGYGEGHGTGRAVDHSIYNALLKYLHREFIKRLGETLDNKVFGIKRYYPGDGHNDNGGDGGYVNGTYSGDGNHAGVPVVDQEEYNN